MANETGPGERALTTARLCRQALAVVFGGGLGDEIATFLLIFRYVFGGAMAGIGNRSGPRSPAAVGFAVGFRLHGSVPAALAASALCVAYGFTFESVFLLAALGHPASCYITRSLLWSAAIIAITAPLAIARYRKG